MNPRPVAREGVIGQAILPGAKVGVIIEIGCDTAFVARDEGFRAFADEAARRIAIEPGADLEDDRRRLEQMMEEPIMIRHSARFEVASHGAVATYIHTGGKVGVIVEVGATKDETVTTNVFQQLARDVTLQIAAANPLCVDRSWVPGATLEREREIYRNQIPPGKQADIVEKIVHGRIEQFYGGVCLVEQAFIKNPDQTIAQLIAARSKELGDELLIRRFLRYSVGKEIAG